MPLNRGDEGSHGVSNDPSYTSALLPDHQRENWWVVPFFRYSVLMSTITSIPINILIVIRITIINSITSVVILLEATLLSTK